MFNNLKAYADVKLRN